MDEKEREASLRETAQQRGFRLVKSRRRKPGGDFGRYGLTDAASGEECLGFGKAGLEATADEVEAYLRRQTASTWKKSLGAAGAAKPGRRRAPRPAPPSPPAPEPREPPKPKLRIREADAVDSEAISALLPAEFAATAEEVADRLPRLVRAGEPPLVAKLGEEVVGVLTWHVMAVLHRPAPVGRITFLQVAEARQRGGIGRALVEAAEERMAKRGCGLVEVTSNVKLAPAHKFYARLGYEKTSHRFGKRLKG
jgi:predicted N-acetyltransferase YhbS